MLLINLFFFLGFKAHALVPAPEIKIVTLEKGAQVQTLPQEKFVISIRHFCFFPEGNREFILGYLAHVDCQPGQKAHVLNPAITLILRPENFLGYGVTYRLNSAATETHFEAPAQPEFYLLKLIANSVRRVLETIRPDNPLIMLFDERRQLVRVVKFKSSL